MQGRPDNGTLVNGDLELLNSRGTQLDCNDDADAGTRDAQIVFEAAASGTYYLNASGVGVNTVTYTLLATQGAAAAPSTQTAQAAKADAFSFKTSGFTVEEIETTRGNRDALAPASPWDAMAGSQFGEDIMGWGEYGGTALMAKVLAGSHDAGDFVL
ncbi:MAG: PPC domain-containing protein [Pseudomonadota bacterium]|nr:PPC domain-containing protein [Pseudomonadota bacterium]